MLIRHNTVLITLLHFNWGVGRVKIGTAQCSCLRSSCPQDNLTSCSSAMVVLDSSIYRYLIEGLAPGSIIRVSITITNEGGSTKGPTLSIRTKDYGEEEEGSMLGFGVHQSGKTIKSRNASKIFHLPNFSPNFAILNFLVLLVFN